MPALESISAGVVAEAAIELALAALLVSCLPARAASKVDPVTAHPCGKNRKPGPRQQACRGATRA